jgi:hypothetical protein
MMLYRVTQQEQDYYKFKVPSLRNVEVRPLCMMGVLNPRVGAQSLQFWHC